MISSGVKGECITLLSPSLNTSETQDDWGLGEGGTGVGMMERLGGGGDGPDVDKGEGANDVLRGLGVRLNFEVVGEADRRPQRAENLPAFFPFPFSTRTEEGG